MNLNSTYSLPVYRWVFGKCVLFALLGLLALDGALGVTSAFADFTISPPTLAFTATVGSPNKTGSVTVTNTGTTALRVTYADSINWLVAITPGLSQTIQPGKSGTFTITASFANLAAGSYSGTGTISGGGITKQVPVTLTLIPASSTTSSTGTFNISPSTLAFTATVGSPNKTGSVTVTNTGTTALTVTYADSINWLVAITPGLSQTIQPGQSGTFTLTASFANLAAGSYSGTAKISGGGITKQLPVTLTLTVTPSTISVITLTPPAPSIQVHQTQQFVATATDASGTPISGLTFTWRSSTPTVASINSAGLATGLAEGTATITATNGTVTSNPITLTVAPSTISFITLTPPAPFIQVHQTQQFVATATDASGTPISGLTPTWRSSAPTVASIDSAGLATGLAQGTATITATNGTMTSNPITLTVAPSTVSFITLTPPAPSIQVRQTQQFIATATDASGTPISGLTPTWRSSAPTVASIDSAGLATGLAQGTATITATNGTVTSNPITLTVAPSTVSVITLTPPAPSIQVQQTQQFVATAMDASGMPISGLTFTWAASSPTVASIDSTGLATGLAQGTATITATNGTMTSNQGTLTVTAASAGPRVYTTTFPLAENPIFENGNWIGGKTAGLAWSDFQSDAGPRLRQATRHYTLL